MRAAAAIALCLVALAPASAKDKGADWWTRLNASNPTDIQDLIGVEDDAMETFVRVTSRAVYQEKTGGLIKSVRADHFLSATIDRKTGAIAYSFVFWASYSGDRGIHIQRMNAEGPDGPVPLEHAQRPNEVAGCTRYGCVLNSELLAIVPRDVLDWAARKPASSPWKVRLGFDAGNGDRETSPVEVAAFLMKVDEVAARIANGEPAAKLQF